MTVAVLDPPAVSVRPARLNLPAAHIWVVVEMFELGTLAHQHIDGATRTPCGYKTWPFWRMPTAKAMRFRPRFCPTCFPGGRCQICRVPSGDCTECARCSAVSDRIDKAFARGDH